MHDLIAFGAMVALIFVVAGWVKGVVGLGLPTVAMGGLALFMPPVQAAAFLVGPSLVTNLWQLFAGPAFMPLLRRFASMLVAICVGTAAGIGFLTSASRWPGIALGAVLGIYGALGLSNPRLSIDPKLQPFLSPVAGFATGVLTGATGVFVVPAVPYLSALKLGKDELVQALGLSFTVSTLALAACLAAVARYPSGIATSSLLAVAPALIGMFVGQRVRDKLNAAVFRKWFFSAMLAVGIFMIVRASWEVA